MIIISSDGDWVYGLLLVNEQKQPMGRIIEIDTDHKTCVHETGEVLEWEWLFYPGDPEILPQSFVDMEKERTDIRITSRHMMRSIVDG